MTKLMQDQNVPTSIVNMRSLYDLFFYDSIRKAGLMEENRIGFVFGSPTIALDVVPASAGTSLHFNTVNAIQGSKSRIKKIQNIMKQFPTCSAIIETH